MPATQQTPWFDALVKHEQRLELRQHISDGDALNWLLAKPQRWAFWCEALTKADLDGCFNPKELESIRYFTTYMMRKYLYNNLVSYGLIKRLADGRLQIIDDNT